MFEQGSPVAVVTGRAVGDVCAGHQQEGPEQVDDAAEGQDQEGGLDGDVLLMQYLEDTHTHTQPYYKILQNPTSGLSPMLHFDWLSYL